MYLYTHIYILSLVPGLVNKLLLHANALCSLAFLSPLALRCLFSAPEPPARGCTQPSTPCRAGNAAGSDEIPDFFARKRNSPQHSPSLPSLPATRCWLAKFSLCIVDHVNAHSPVTLTANPLQKLSGVTTYVFGQNHIVFVRASNIKDLTLQQHDAHSLMDRVHRARRSSNDPDLSHRSYWLGILLWFTPNPTGLAANCKDQKTLVLDSKPSSKGRASIKGPWSPIMLFYDGFDHVWKKCVEKCHSKSLLKKYADWACLHTLRGSLCALSQNVASCKSCVNHGKGARHGKFCFGLQWNFLPSNHPSGPRHQAYLWFEASTLFAYKTVKLNPKNLPRPWPNF